MSELVEKDGKKYKVEGEFYISEDEALVIYRGVKFIWFDGYYRKKGIFSKDKPSNLHRAVWIDHFGPIPEGYHIHHKDADRRNNRIENLQCLEGGLHLSRSAKNSSWVGSQDNLDTLAKAREKGKQWHSSKEGIKFHKEQIQRIKPWEKIVTFSRKCEQCGKDFRSRQKKGRFCSPKCKSNFRYHVGVDSENRVCIVCGKYFATNRYGETKTCGHTCKTQIFTKTWKNRKKTQVNCIGCGQSYMTCLPTRAKYCNKACWGRSRRKDHITIA
jgi:HNH endonuclease